MASIKDDIPHPGAPALPSGRPLYEMRTTFLDLALSGVPQNAGSERYRKVTDKRTARSPGSMRYMDIVKTIAAVVSAVALLVIAGTTLRLLERQDDLLQVEHFQSGCLESIVENLRAAPGSPQLGCRYTP